MANILNIGISGLKAQQTALTVTGNNITNAGNEGYSRQVVNLSENDPQFKGGVWVGHGVNVQSVKRVYDEFLTEQLRRDTSTFNEFNALATNAEQINGLLADAGTGVQPGLERFFGAMQAAVDDPSSLPAREVLITEANGLVDRFATIFDRLYAQNEVINGQMEVIAGEISTIARSIAELNAEIQFATATAQGVEPNELMDQRERLLKDLSEYVKVNVVKQDDNVFNVFIGNGQALIVGNDFNEVFVDQGAQDPNRFDIYFRKENVIQNVTKEIAGGQLGGILDFRSDILDPTFNQMGRLALTITETMNDQHRLGVDYDGLKGQEFFTDINEPSKMYRRVAGDRNNADPDDRVIAIEIKDAGAMSISDYRLEFAGPDDYTYRVTRLSDGEVVATQAFSGAFPDSVEFDGLEMRFEAGSFQQGDEFLISPTRLESRSFDMYVTRAEQVALASPISAEAAIGNRGNGTIDQGEVYDLTTSYFEEEGELSPPLLIKFTSETSYDVLDNTDPGNPIPLFPPLMNQTFIPGIDNQILPMDEGKTGFTSFGGVLPVAQTYQQAGTTVEANNGFFPERIDITYTDPDSGMERTQKTLVTPLHASAREIADALSSREGIEATARTTVELTNFKEDSTPFLDTDITLNGVILTDGGLGPNQKKYDLDYPTDVPERLDTDFLAARINANFELREKGIIARSDGDTLTVIALNGDDLEWEIFGDHDDSFEISNGQDIKVRETGEATTVLLNEYEGYNFNEGGPYTYAFDVPGQGEFSFEMTGNYTTPDDMLEGFRIAIERSGLVFSGKVDVDINEKGQITFQPRLEVTGAGSTGTNKITIGGQVKVVADEHYSLSINPPGNNLFDAEPVGEPIAFGFNVVVDGIVADGDEFLIDFNTDGTSDSRNGVAMAALQNERTINGQSSYSDSYARVVEVAGATTSRAQINRDSSEVLLRNAQDAVDSTSGVNLDEEAAALIKYELAYNASAQVIQVARQIFETLIGTFR